MSNKKVVNGKSILAIAKGRSSAANTATLNKSLVNNFSSRVQQSMKKVSARLKQSKKRMMA